MEHYKRTWIIVVLITTFLYAGPLGIFLGSPTAQNFSWLYGGIETPCDAFFCATFSIIGWVFFLVYIGLIGFCIYYLAHRIYLRINRRKYLLNFLAVLFAFLTPLMLSYPIYAVMPDLPTSIRCAGVLPTDDTKIDAFFDVQSLCALDLAIEKKDASICEVFGYPEEQNTDVAYCVGKVVEALKDPTLCDGYTNKTAKQVCLTGSYK